MVGDLSCCLITTTTQLLHPPVTMSCRYFQANSRWSTNCASAPSPLPHLESYWQFSCPGTSDRNLNFWPFGQILPGLRNNRGFTRNNGQKTFASHSTKTKELNFELVANWNRTGTEMLKCSAFGFLQRLWSFSHPHGRMTANSSRPILGLKEHVRSA